MPLLPPDFPDLPDDQPLWRYMDLFRFLDLLQTSQLHLARADQMEDRWEGSFSPVNIAERPNYYGERWEMMEPYLPMIYHHARTHVYLNCWYSGSVESYAMWKLYGAEGKGVAIRTTVGRLKSSLVGAEDEKILGAEVQYVDYDQEFIPEINMLSPYVYKRLSFEHEREYRLIEMWSPKVLECDEDGTATRHEEDNPPAFIRKSVDLSTLIESIYVSPDAPNWVASVIQRVVSDYRPGFDVKHSHLGVDPIY